MGLFTNRKNGGLFADVIRCDEPDYLIWKWRPAGNAAGNTRRENAIRWGSPIRVKDGSVAVFVYSQNGRAQDFIEGPFDDALETSNLPILSGLMGALLNGGTMFQAEVYFINLANIIQIKFGVPFFDIFDKDMPQYSVPVAVRGSFNFRIADYREFIKLHRLEEFDMDTFKKQIKDTLTRYVKEVVSNASTDLNIPVVQIERRTATINDAVEEKVRDRFVREYGVIVSGLDISAIEIDKDSSDYQELLSVTRGVTTGQVYAQARANEKNIADMQAIMAEDQRENLRINREEAQFAQHMQTANNNFAAYQMDLQAKTAMAGAEALGKMGSNGAGSYSSGGFDPASMMASMAMAGTIGKNMANNMNEMMANTPAASAPAASAPPVAPPPIPEVKYHIAVGKQATGPYTVEEIAQMAQEMKVSGQTLVWKPGMAKWAQLDSVDDLKGVLDFIPPSID